MKNAYERFVRPLLFSIDPETAHRLTIGSLRAASHVNLALRALSVFQPPAKPKKLFGLNFPNPIGLAAGLDKNGVALPAWAALGFGFIEIGTVAHRLTKLHRSGRWPDVPIGINIGKSMSTPLTEASEDYLYSFRLLREFADYIVLNVSSPNTPGLRELQGLDALSELLSAIGKKNLITRKPIVVKIAPDLAPEELEQIVSTCEANKVAAIIATNTTLDHSSIPTAQDEQGGLSGAPLRDKSSALVRAIAAKSTIPVIASGGITDASSAREKIEAGAQLLQIYTGLIYRGPGLLREIAGAIK